MVLVIRTGGALDRTNTWTSTLRRIPPLDGVLAVLCLALAGVYSTFILDYGPRWPYVVNVVLHVGLSVALLIRRIRVRVAFVVTYVMLGSLTLLAWVSPLAVGVSPALLCAPLSLWTVARRDPDQRWGIAALVLAVAGSFASPLRNWGSILLLPLLLVLVFIGVYLMAAHLRRNELVHAAELESHAALAAAAERARIARELHDIVAHSLTVVGVQAKTGLAVGTPEQLRRSLAAVSAASTAAMAEVRALVDALRDNDQGRTPTGDLTRLHDLVASSRASGIDLEANLPDALTLTRWQETWPSHLRLTVLRVIQEALTNIVKHGGRTPHARLDLTVADDALHLLVCNDRASDAAQRGYGLVGLKERVALSGGTIDAGRNSDGFLVRVRLPLHDVFGERA